MGMASADLMLLGLPIAEHRYDLMISEPVARDSSTSSSIKPMLRRTGQTGPVKPRLGTGRRRLPHNNGCGR
jgi:hypothetical protein